MHIIKKPTALLFYLFLIIMVSYANAEKPPNVVLVITDDQGYGDIEAHGNPIIKTPALNQLLSESVSLKDYHVAPTCAPTRSALQTGHWTNRTGVWHTIMGRSLLRENEITMGQVFKENGYATGLFGKWHLGDNYPFRPEDRGYSEVLRHGGGGVGQTPDYWNNAYFNGTYFHNSKPVKVKGFCTDVWFDYAKRFIREQKKADKPFFAYISTNAPHGPMHAPVEYSNAYQDQEVRQANFFGMITNIDSNIATMRAFLEREGLAENTIFIFTTDNGSANGQYYHGSKNTSSYNAGMRGRKGSEYDGGHRVPFFIHWPKGDLVGGRNVEALTAHVDILPTLIDLTGIKAPGGVSFDGVSLKPLLHGMDEKEWPDRILITDSQRVKDPIKWRKSAVMTSQWRLINGRELYDIKADPGQTRDIAAENPQVVKRLANFYNAWWTELQPTFKQEAAIYLGHAAGNPATLTSHDWITEQRVPWNQRNIREAVGKGTTGFWRVNIVEDGTYKIRLRRWPEESGAALGAALAPGAIVPGDQAYRARPGKALDIVKASVRIGDRVEQIKVDPGAQEAVFNLKLNAEQTRLTATFETRQGDLYGAYYAYISKQ